MSLPVQPCDTHVFPPRQIPAPRSPVAPHRAPVEPSPARTLDAALARLSLLPSSDHGTCMYPGRVELDDGAEETWMALKGSELSNLSRRDFGIWSPEFRHHPGEHRRLLGSCPDGREISGAEAEVLRPAFDTPYGQVCLYRDGSWGDYYTDRISQVSQNTNLSQQNGLLNDYSRLCLGVTDDGYRVNGLVSGSSLSDRRARFAQASLNCTCIEAMRGRIESIATDPEGFRVLLSMMERMDTDETELVFSETIGRVGYLMTDPFANHVVQRLVEACSEEQRKQILYAVTWNSHIVSICLSTYGIRSIQKLMDTLTTRWQKNAVIHALAPFMYQLIKNAVGHHVIRHCLKVFSNEDNEFLYDLVATKCYEIATDKSGCCILQQCVEHAQGKQRDCLVAEITTLALLLAENRYGNYVVQHLLTLEIPQVADDLHRQFLGSYATLSCNKYGSNVVEKCLKEMGYNQFKQIVVELLEEFLAVLLNEFGNYVIRRAVEVSKEQRQTQQIYYILSAELKRYDPLIKSNPYGKKAVSRLEKQNILP